ncbi:MAG: hypothetical protein MHPDNHAH_03482 [Anaerolineales bacterium]|nr:hypothetical protein [Anaerolineales bacterium]
MTPTRQRALVIGLIGIGLALALIFGLRSFHAFREFRGHPPPFPPPPAAQAQQLETDVELIREWMTIGYLAYTYQTPPDLLYNALDISPKGNEKKSLEELNAEYYPDQPGYVLETVKATIQSYLANSSVTPTTSP